MSLRVAILSVVLSEAKDLIADCDRPDGHAGDEILRFAQDDRVRMAAD
jgi:hypothetical protein